MSVLDIAVEKCHLKQGALPKDYHCECAFCKKSLGEIIRPDGSYYNKNDRKKYYSKVELSNAKEGEKGGHIAKTPLHIARWAIQTYTKPNDWVLDPTMGAGTTAVEALNHERNVAGMEIEFIDVIKANIEANNTHNKQWDVWHGDARALSGPLAELGQKFSLIVNNPPYSGDESQKGKGVREGFTYDKNLPNLAFLKEGAAYYETIGSIYAESCKYLKKNGHLVIGVKDQMRKKEPDMLHRKLGEAILKYVPNMEFVGTAVLKHFPTTLFLNTYFKQFGIHPPYYQSILVFKKVK
jgi:methylase of polypeptide subunit release factors